MQVAEVDVAAAAFDGDDGAQLQFGCSIHVDVDVRMILI